MSLLVSLDPDVAFTAALMEAVPDPIVLVGRRSVVVFCNAAARTTWPALAEGLPIAFTLRSPTIVDAVERALLGAGPVKADYTERVPVERVFSLQATRLATRPGGRRSEDVVVLAFRDLTEARRLESMRVDFIANASHELRTPLASLLGFIETLQGPARDDAAARGRFLQIMREQARRMARLIDDLLSLSRVELSEHRHPETAVDLAALARQVADTMRPLATERQVEIRLRADQPVMVRGDPDELLRVADNLIENAIKYGQSGGKVEVTVEAADEAGGRHGVLSVRDHGPGIAPEHLPRLTERFYRVITVDTRDKGGTGLGLAIVKHIVNRHRGRMTVESRLGEGALFRVAIPLAGPDA